MRYPAAVVQNVKPALENLMENIDELLVSTCRTMIKTILVCLDKATKGTIYRIGLMPDLTAVRVTSGIRKPDSDEIKWGLPAVSDYNPPGKKWEQYRDQPGRVLEAMGWCVEQQKSWTAENPLEDVRSVRKQISGELEDFYHMEPVLVRKQNLYGSSTTRLRYPLDWRGNPIWQDSEFVVAAIIKIHFEPGKIKRDDRSTAVIRELSRNLGTELLSLWLRDTLSIARKDFARQRLQSCEILAHELRNTLVKLGFVFSALNAQIGILREGWENLLQANISGLEWKYAVLEELSRVLSEKSAGVELSREQAEIVRNLQTNQNELARLSLSPHQEQEWVRNKIIPKWKRILSSTSFWDRKEIESLLDRLTNSLHTGMQVDPAKKIDGLPDDLTEKWSRLAYVQITSGNLFLIDEVLQLVDHPALPIPHKNQIARVLKSLKALVLTIPEVEEKATRILQSLRNGSWAEEYVHYEPGILDLDCRGDQGVALTD
jgi:hypothetical protein